MIFYEIHLIHSLHRQEAVSDTHLLPILYTPIPKVSMIEQPFAADLEIHIFLYIPINKEG